VRERERETEKKEMPRSQRARVSIHFYEWFMFMFIWRTFRSTTPWHGRILHKSQKWNLKTGDHKK